jgi:hypothetical protein
MESPHPSPSSEPLPATGTVTDRRVPPKGVIPRGTQTWPLAGLALFMLVIMLIVGRPEPQTPRAAAAAPATTPVQSADRVREYQERLRLPKHKPVHLRRYCAESSMARGRTAAAAGSHAVNDAKTCGRRSHGPC